MAVCSFGGSEFELMIGSGSIPLVNREGFLTERHIPGSDINYVDLGGRGAGHLSLPITLVDEAALGELANQLNTQATLVYDGITYGGAILQAVTNPRRIVGNNLIMCEVQFIL